MFAALTLCAALALAIWASSSGSPAHSRSAGHRTGRTSALRLPAGPDRFAGRRLAVALPFARQDAACAYLWSGRVVLLGGLNASDTSTALVNVLDAQGVRSGGMLPEAQHDAQAALLDGRVYVFGGGQFTSYSHILAYDPASERVSQVASLPTATSDAAVAVSRAPPTSSVATTASVRLTRSSHGARENTRGSWGASLTVCAMRRSQRAPGGF